MTITFLNFGDKLNMFGQALKGNGEAQAKALMELNMAPISYQLAKESVQGGQQLYQGVSSQGMNYFNGVRAGTLANLTASSTSATCYRFFPSQAVQKVLPNCVKALDVSLLETGVGQGILSKLGGSASFSTANGLTKATITGSTAAQVGGKAMARIPVLGILIATAFEIPDIIDAFKNGDGPQQLGRSAMNVACTTIGTAIGGALGTLIPIPGLGTVIGGFIGGMIGSAVGKFLGNAIFGKSKKDQMRDGTQTKQILNTYKNLNFNNVGSGQSVYGGNVGGNYNYAGGGDVDVDKTLAYVYQGMASQGLL